MICADIAVPAPRGSRRGDVLHSAGTFSCGAVLAAWTRGVVIQLFSEGAPAGLAFGLTAGRAMGGNYVMLLVNAGIGFLRRGGMVSRSTLQRNIRA